MNEEILLKEKPETVAVPVIDGFSVQITYFRDLKSQLGHLMSASYDGLPLPNPGAKKTSCDIIETLRKKHEVRFQDEFHARKHIKNALRGNFTQN